jgi:hypothetical protein
MRRLAAITLLAGLSLLGAAAPAQAQSFGSDGAIYAVVDCNLATNTASVSVVVMEPFKYATSGLVFYTEVWAKSRGESRYNLIRSVQTKTVKTWSTYNPNPFVPGSASWMNNPTTILSTSFTGRVEDYYDIYVKWWFRLPTSSSWNGAYGFTVAGDPHSHIDITSNDGFGNLSSPATQCFL